MNFLPSLLLLVASRWSRGLLGATILSALVWSYLPMIPALAGPIPRTLAIVAIFAAFGLVTWLVERRAKKRARAVEAAVVGDEKTAAGSTEAADSQAEVAALRKRLREAMGTLRKRGVKRLYELPWYVIIGPPGSGKTTALRQSGLHFPLDGDQADSLQGVGGTRMCDWWFSEEAVLIDTAGRYTTHDSNRSVDKAGWLGFLDLLRTTRPRQPINGVLVVIALSELLESTPENRDAHARAIRLRLNELNERLRVRLPIYLVFSKMDRLAGFDTYFETLDSRAREQVWGVTLGLEEGVDAFPAEFKALVDRIEAGLLDRMQTERGPDRRALLSGFPLQVASLSPVLMPFLRTCFAGSRIDPAPFLRGVYFTSATQNGAPFDRLTGMLAQSFDIDQKRVSALKSSAGKAFFLSRLVREVILGETPLVSTSPGRFRRRKIVRATALGAIALIGVGGLVLIWAADLQARVAVQRRQDALEAYRRDIDHFPSGIVDTRQDLDQVSALLDKAAALAEPEHEPLAAAIGLSTADRLTEAGRVAYASSLDHLLYPRLVWRLEEQMRADMQDPDALYNATRVYLLLGGNGPHEPGVIRSWILADWNERFGGVLNAPLREHLTRHLDALLSAPLPSDQLKLDGTLVAEARVAFSHVSPAQRVYDRLKAGAEAGMPGTAEQVGWSPRMALGDAADATFTRRSGAPLSDGIPAFLTGRAFADTMRRDLPPAARQVADESWVLGKDPGMSNGGADVALLEQQVARLWEADAVSHWDALLADLDLVPLGSGQHLQDSLYLLSSPQSPVRDMLNSIVRALRIAMPAPGDPSRDVAAEWTAHWQSLYSLMAVSPYEGGKTAPPPPSGPPPLDAILQLIAQLDNVLASGTAAPASLPQAAALSADPARRLQAESERQPHPLSQWLASISGAGGATLGQEAKSAASGAYNGANGPDAICHSLVDNRFPFSPGASQNASLADFSRLFAPGGQFDRYFQTSMAPYVDVSATPWRLHPAGGVQPPFTQAQLAPFVRAAAIRDAFFPVGGQPSVYFTVSLTAPAGTALHLGSVTVQPGTPASLSWPGSDGLSPASLQPPPEKKGGQAAPALASEQGPWALFRLLANAEPTDDTPISGTHQYLFVRGGQSASIEIGADGSGASSQGGNKAPKRADPFDPALLSGFTCPTIR
ncbi:type VI secretion system membrane subunit TssM [Acetobacteraceae bacterium KSS8]|uniref:Type VI secretion system membrane subunit TssM n=1 Tax=Endosaccharibacter trunci TaxID=2812733 RepID=A0ABT1W9Y9_9PROT|nr:type VI secretion system membrane subunit TssM [Acetobacteraceae bacterium KSS8]